MTAPTETTYLEYFSNDSNNPYTDDMKAGYRATMSLWRTTGSTVPTAHELRVQTCLEFSTTPIGAVGVFVGGTEETPGGVLKLIQGMATYTGQPGKQSPEKGKPFAFVGDTMGLDIQSILMPEYMFEMTDETTIPGTTESFSQQRGADEDTILLGPYKNANAKGMKTKQTTRCSMYIPFELVPLVWGKDLNPKEAYDVLHPAIQARGLEEACGLLTTWLRMACISNGTDYESVITLDMDLVNRAVPIPVVHQRRSLLKRDLPALFPGGTGGAQGLDGVVAGLTALVDERRADRNQRTLEKLEEDRPTTVRKKFGGRVTDMLLRVSGAVRDEDLPKLYHELAGKPKGYPDRLLFQHQVHDMCNKLGIPKVEVTAGQMLALKNLKFIGAFPTDIGTSLDCFSIIPPNSTTKAGQEAVLKAQEQSNKYDTAATAIEEGVLGLDDMTKLKGKGAYIPADRSEAMAQLTAYHGLAATLFGETCVAVSSYKQFLLQYQGLEGEVTGALIRSHGPKLAPATMVYHINLIWRHWLKRKMDGPTEQVVPAPDFTIGLTQHQTLQNTSWAPDVSQVPALAKLAKPDNQGSTGGGTGGATGGATGGGNGTTSPSNRVRNPNRLPELVGNSPLAQRVSTARISDVIRDHGVPPKGRRNGAEVDRCINYHAKGQCGTNCVRVNDHHPIPAGEKQAFLEWCQTAFQA